MRIAWPLLLVAMRATAQDLPPLPHWEIEIDATEDFDDVQHTSAGTVHTHHLAHFKVVLDAESPAPIDDHLRISTRHARVVSHEGRFDGGRHAVTPTTDATSTYEGKLLPDQVTLSLSYDAPDAWAGTFQLPVRAVGTCLACVVHADKRTCAKSEAAPLAPFGWTFDSRRGGGTFTREGDTWLFRYSRDVPDGPGQTRHHRELTLRMRPVAASGGLATR